MIHESGAPRPSAEQVCWTAERFRWARPPRRAPSGAPGRCWSRIAGHDKSRGRAGRGISGRAGGIPTVMKRRRPRHGGVARSRARVHGATRAGPPRTRTSNVIPIRALAGYLFRVAASRLRRQQRATELAYDQVVRGPVWACTDLGAFPRPPARLQGVEGVVVMEDRHPQFFLSFREYTPRAATGLNRHGPLHQWSTQRDLRNLVGTLHAQGVPVVIGFWNYGGWWPLPLPMAPPASRAPPRPRQRRPEPVRPA